MRRMILTMAAFAVVGCVRTHANEATGEVDVDIESPTKQGEDWSGTLSPRGGSAITGSFKAIVADGKTTVSVNLANAMAGQRLPWQRHGHLRRCLVVSADRRCERRNRVGEHGSELHTR